MQYAWGNKKGPSRFRFEKKQIKYFTFNGALNLKKTFVEKSFSVEFLKKFLCWAITKDIMFPYNTLEHINLIKI
jgi:hypothetical protein